jgi:hypothetical protein
MARPPGPWSSSISSSPSPFFSRTTPPPSPTTATTPANIGDPNRASTAFRLYTSPDANFTSLQLVSEAALTPGYINTYGTNAILINDTLTNVTGRFFRLEMVRANAGGPRIRELDGFGTPVPEPVGAAFLLLAPLGLLARRRG